MPHSLKADILMLKGFRTNPFDHSVRFKIVPETSPWIAANGAGVEIGIGATSYSVPPADSVTLVLRGRRSSAPLRLIA